jgi:chemotaxis protein MotB
MARHADDWLVTYADMITLLLCFFVLFLVVTVAQKNAAPHEVLATAKTAVLFEPVRGAEEPTTAPSPPPLPEGAWRSVDSLPSDVSRPEAPPPEPPAAAVEPLPSDVPPQQAELPPDLPTLTQRLNEQTPIELQQQGDRLTTLDINSAAFFDSGSALLSVAGKKILRDVAATLRDPSYRDYQITVEGHTDDTPINTPQFPSNWELSTARASAVVRFFLELGLEPARLRAAGYAATFPKKPNRDADGRALPANQAQNRRVVIKLEKIDRP